uniref:INO80 complex subunit C n=2 Tax=Gadus morhua TaxID=8049 RepID=A0A8C5F373_GADMO
MQQKPYLRHLRFLQQMASPVPPNNSTPKTGSIPTLTAGKILLLANNSAAFRGKKRSSSPATCSSPQTSNIIGKKKKGPCTTTPTLAQMVSPETLTEIKVVGKVEGNVSQTTTELTVNTPSFKAPTFTHSGIGGAAAGKKNRTWKNLKQILVLERTLPWTVNDPNYFCIDAPPSLKPAKKYSDISGLPANYTDPQTKLRFTSSEEFSYIRLLPTDVVTGYLALRKATCIVP